MAGLKVLGITVGVVRCVHRVVPVGARVESLMTERDRFLGFVDEWDIETEPMLGVDADSLVALLDGRAHVMPWDVDAWSKAGLPPTSMAGWTLESATPAPKHGAKYVEVSASITYLIDFLLSPTQWTAVFFRWNGAAWVHLIVRSDGAKWVDGVRNDAFATGFLSVNTSAGSFSLDSSGTAYDDGAVFPGLLSATHAPLLYTHHNAQALASARKLTIEGDIFEGGGQRTCRAFNAARLARPASNPSTGAWDADAATVSFRLAEVKT